MSPPPEDQQLRWSVSPLGSKLDSFKHVFNLLSFQVRKSIQYILPSNYISYSESSRRDWCGDGARRLFFVVVVVVMRLS